MTTATDDTPAGGYCSCKEWDAYGYLDDLYDMWEEHL